MQVQDVCLRVLFDDGEVERVVRIERDDDGANLRVRTARGLVVPAERIVSIHN